MTASGPKDTAKQAQRIAEIGNAMAQQMSVCAAHIRSKAYLEELQKTAKAHLEEVKTMSAALCTENLLRWFKLRDMLTTQIAMIDSMLQAQIRIGSRGGSIFLSDALAWTVSQANC